MAFWLWSDWRIEFWSLRPLVKALQVLCGVQLLTAVIPVAEIGNLARFASAPKLNMRNRYWRVVDS